MTSNHRSNYRWYILTLAALTHVFVCGISVSCIPVLFSEIAEELGLNLVQIGIIWGTGSLAGVATGLIGGLISDRYGTKRTLSTGCLLAAVTGALRGLSDGFIGLVVTMFFFGFLLVTISLAVHKTAGEWFPSRRLGIANGILSAGMGVGVTVGAMVSATVLSPLLGSWRQVLFLYGAISLVFSLLWLLSKPEVAPREAASPSGAIPLRQALSLVTGIRNVWLLALVMLCYWACLNGVTGYLPLYLRNLGWPAASADGALAALNAASTTAVIPLALLSDRIGSRKPILIITLVITAIGVGLLSVANGAAVWPVVVLVGLFHDGFMAIIITLTIETDRVGAAYAGTAVGLTMSLGSLGDFIGPPLGNSFARIDTGLPFVFWAALAMISVPAFRFMKDTRRGKNESER